MHQADFAALRPDKSNSSNQTPTLGEKNPRGADPELSRAVRAMQLLPAAPRWRSRSAFFSPLIWSKMIQKRAKGERQHEEGLGAAVME